MNPDFDLIIVGSGPAGVSAAHALINSGLRILMVDGGNTSDIALPEHSFLETRVHDENQWKWLVGEQFQALSKQNTGSPKLRVPTHAFVFEDFSEVNAIEAKNFIGIGSLATGGLSNAWGCGVSKLSQIELKQFPIDVAEMEVSYETVTKRIGVSGCNRDDLTDYFGLDAWGQPPITMDKRHERLYRQYMKYKTKVVSGGFHLGRSRVAALKYDHAGRKACNYLSNCLWGCSRRALYSAAYELNYLRKDKYFSHEPGFILEKVIHQNKLWNIQGKHKRDQILRTISCSKLILAAGTLATTRLVLNALRYQHERPLLSCPTAVFMLWLPRLLGAASPSTFGLAQLSFTQHIQAGVTGFGSTISTHGLLMSEFIKQLPLTRRCSTDVLKSVLSSCVVANLFLPGDLSAYVAHVKHHDKLSIEGDYHEDVMHLMRVAKKKLQASFRHLGAYVLPMSFHVNAPGSDIHYAGTLPMCANPREGETSTVGEVYGLQGLYVVDGACLPMLSEKSHTLTIMANADRIARAIRRDYA